MNEKDVEVAVSEEASPTELKKLGVVRAHVMLGVAAVIYSGYNVVLDASFRDDEQLTPTLLSLCREVVSVPVLYAYAWAVEGPLEVPPRVDRRTFAALALVLGLFQMSFMVGVSLTDGDTAALFQCVEPSTAAVVAALVGFERCSVKKVASALLAGAGVVVLQLANGGSSAQKTASLSYLVGCVLLFGQGLGISVYCLIQKRLVDPQQTAANKPRRRYGPVTVTAHAYLGSLVVMVLAVLLSTSASLEDPTPLSRRGLAALADWRAVVVVAYSALLSSVVGYSLRAAANVVLDASMLVLYNAVQPPVTALLSFLFFQDPVGPAAALAAALILAAVLVAARDHASSLHTQRRKPTPLLSRDHHHLPLHDDDDVTSTASGASSSHDNNTTALLAHHHRNS